MNNNLYKNIIYMGTLKNLRSGTLDKLPTSEQITIGQLALNFNHLNPFICIKTDDDKMVQFFPPREWVGTQAQFDLIEYRNPNVTYYITE